MKEKIIAVREYREKLLSDPYRPKYHFVVPDDNGYPGDSNGAFFADGVYHLMYLYLSSKTDGYHWGHISSCDLLHWRQHPDALTVYEGDRGCFSGGAFLDDDKTVYLTFWKFPSVDENKDKSGVAIAFSKPPYDKWERVEPIAVNATEWGIKDVVIDGEIMHLGCADPSNIWKMNGYYYMQLGNLCVLNKYGREEDSPEKYQGGWTELYKSKDLREWSYVGRFYENTFTGEDDWPDKTEDDMCPSFLPLYDAKSGGNKTDKWLQLFISHNKGCQYFIGGLKDEKFYPENHGRMSWNDKTFFAPEGLIDDKNRQIIWTWLLDNPENEFETFGWSGVYCFPRVVWLDGDTLRMAPAEELDRLQYNHQGIECITDNSVAVKNGRSLRIKAEWKVSDQKSGLKVMVSNDGSKYVEIYYDKKSSKLVFDATKSSENIKRLFEEHCSTEEAPFELKENELLCLDVFVDKSIIEVYANERQAICRRVYCAEPDNDTGVEIIGNGLCKFDAWEMEATNMY